MLRPMWRHRASCFLVPLLAIVAPARAHADAASAASAQALFEEGKKLAAQESFAAACPKFAESQRLDPAAGTLLHLGNCYEKIGKTASAWATFLDAAAAARQQNRGEWEKLARDRAAELEPKLSRLAVRVADRPAGFVVKRDDVVLSEASLGTPLPVDPGPHRVLATAPDRKPRELDVVVKPGGHRAEIVIPALELAPKAASGPLDRGARGGSSTRTIGYAVAGVGVVGLGVGTVTGLLAIGKNSDARRLCPTERCASQEGIDANASARSFGTVSTIGFVAGGVALAAGAVLIFTGGSSKDSALRVAPVVGAEGGSLVMGGAF